MGLFWIGVFVARTLGRKTSFSLAPIGFILPKSGTLKGISFGLAVGIGAAVVGALLNAVSTVVFESLGYSADSRAQQPFMQALESLVQDNPALAIPAIVFAVVIFGPFVEELVFRAAIFNGLYRLARLVPASILGKEVTRSADLISFAAAALASSGFFALLHLDPILLPTLITLAVALCALFRWSGSLLPSFVAHATFNSFATTLIILSGLGVFNLPV
ncbi:MAG: CPBP family intramembrane glutamic endopeptidase [Rubrobacteraceae bacterium]